MTVELPAIQVSATAPGYKPPQGLPFPAPHPGMVFHAQMLQRHNYYAQGLWREMVIKICAEQAENMTNGEILYNVVPSFRMDCNSLEWADTYLSSRPSTLPGEALWYVSRTMDTGNKTVPEASMPTQFSGSVLTPVAALGHFMYGNGTDARTSINSLGLNLNSSSIAALDNALASATVGSSRISLDKIPYDTANDSWMTGLWLGNITLKVEGTITKFSDGRANFDGEARAYNDTYDANPGTWRSAFGESATAVLSKIQEKLNATPYSIEIHGSYPISIQK